MDRIEKFLRKLSKRELFLVQGVIEKLLGNDTKKLDIKKLKGHEDVYRVRIQSLRIIFRKTNADIKILEIARRNEKTYKNY